MIFLAWRRGNWLYQFAGLMVAPKPVPGEVRRMPTDEERAIKHSSLFYRVFRRAVADSWMGCAIVFTKACSGNHCRLCTASSARGMCARRGRGGGPHLVLLVVREDGAAWVVDEPFDDNDAWLFVRLDDGLETAAWTFAQEVKGCSYNLAGSVYNFVPRLLRPMLSGPVGVDESNEIDPQRGLFCSEMATVFVRKHVIKDLDLIPCQTTPQQLLDTVLTRNPFLQQYMLSGESKLSAMFVARIV